MYDDIDFNEIDFGTLISESEIDGIEHLTRESVHQMMQESGLPRSIGASPLMALHRSRPTKKIVLSSHPNGTGIDGFGNQIINIQNTTPNLQQVVSEAITQLVCESLEGKASINSINNRDYTFLDLSGSLVDCGPNEDGLESLFDILHLQTPDGFLEDLARRLMSIYEISVSVVDGDSPGLLIRRDTPNK